jgi:hypothetical protein
MAKKLDPKDQDYVDKLSKNLEGVGFSGAEELQTAVEEVADNTPSSLFERILRFFGLSSKKKKE